MLARAWMLPGSLTATSMWRHARHRPSSAMPSAGGLKAGARKVSMQWAMASMPVAAVRPAGKPSVSSGSQMATLGMTWGDKMPTLRPSSRMMIAPRPTSLPVPAVVGMATMGSVAAVMFCTPPSIKANWRSGPSWRADTATALARSMEEPPPTAMTPLQSACFKLATPARTAASDGLGGVSLNTARFACPSADFTRSTMPTASTPRSVTIKGLVIPKRSQTSCRSARTPAPK
ncbi:hypothetical protein D3C86_665780 [compost metagenome]